MKRLSLCFLFIAIALQAAEAKDGKDECRIKEKFPPYRWNTNIAEPPSSQDMIRENSWDKPNAIKPTEAMARLRAIKVRYKISISISDDDCKGGLRDEIKDSETITITPIAGGYVSLAKASTSADSHKVLMGEMAQKYGAGLGGVNAESATADFIKKARVPVSPIRIGDEFGFDYGTNDKYTKSLTRICQFGNTSRGSVIGLNGNITDVVCKTTFQHTGDLSWDKSQERYWLLNDYGVFVPQDGTFEMDGQSEIENGPSPVARFLSKISGLSIEIVR
jgi:hypothetical protein